MRAKPRVLIASSEQNFPPPLAEGYAKLDFDAVTGVSNFFLRTGEFDVVQYLWPEEYCGWQHRPDDKTLEKLEESLKYWMEHSWPVTMVHNFYPHGAEGDPLAKRLYDLFYRYSRNIVHFSKSSHELVTREFPSAINAKHSYSKYCAYHQLRSGTIGRLQARAQLGIGQEDFVIAVFGALRFWKEVALLKEAYARTRIPSKRLLMLSRYVESGHAGRLRKRWLEYRLRMWLTKKDVTPVCAHIPEHDIERYFEAADVVPVLRFGDLCSGVIGMGMTFGKLLIAPDTPAYREYLAGTENLFYKIGDPVSLASALEQAYELNYEKVGKENLSLCQDWTWEGIALASLEGYPGPRPVPTGNYRHQAVQ